MWGNFDEISLSISTSNLHEASLFEDHENLGPRTLKKKAPTSLPDTTRRVAKRSKIMHIDDDENDDEKENLNNSIADFFPSPTKWVDKITHDPENAILDAPELMKLIVERTLIDTVKRISPIGGEGIFIAKLETAWKHAMVPAIGACVERLSFCDVPFLQSRCPNPLPYSVLAAIYELKLRRSGLPGKYHKVSVCDEKRWCENCGEVFMMTCDECEPKQFWCPDPTCVERYLLGGEIVCSVSKYCVECDLPIQADAFVAFKPGYCQCSCAPCSRFYEDELKTLP